MGAQGQGGNDQGGGGRPMSTRPAMPGMMPGRQMGMQQGMASMPMTMAQKPMQMGGQPGGGVMAMPGVAQGMQPKPIMPGQPPEMSGQPGQMHPALLMHLLARGGWGGQGGGGGQMGGGGLPG